MTDKKRINSFMAKLSMKPKNKYVNKSFSNFLTQNSIIDVIYGLPLVDRWLLVLSWC